MSAPFKRNKVFTNDLTVIISKGNATLTDVLLNEKLLETVRNEAAQLLNFFFPPEEMEKKEPNLENLDKLIDLSLIPDKKLKEEYRLYQLNRNAANILSNPSKKFQQKLCEDKSKRYFRRLRNFMIKGGEVRYDYMFSGHFTRMFEVALRYSGETLLDTKHTINYNDEFTEEKFLKFIIENSELFSYRDLLSVIIVDFTKYFPTALDLTLRYAAFATLHINEDSETLRDSLNLKEELYTLEEDTLSKLQPVNCICEKIQIPYYLDKKEEVKSELSSIKYDSEFISKLKSILQYDKINEDKIFSISTDIEPNFRWSKYALNLINSIKNSLEFEIFETVVNRIEQEEKEGKDSFIVICLLICGMFADSKSTLSYTAFSILFNLLNKPHIDHDDMIDDKFILNTHLPKIIDEFAENFKYDPYNVTETMISSLLVFWNHRYKEVPNIKQKEGGANVLPNYKTKSGVTPLELLLPTILTEPIYSSKLNNIFIRIISSLEQEIIDNIEKEFYAKRGKNRQSDESSNQPNPIESSEQRCFEIDSIWYELLTYEFKLSPKDEEYVTLIKALEKLLPLPTNDPFYAQGLKETNDHLRYRIPTNPVFFVLSYTINHGAFFSYKKGINFMKLFNDSYIPKWVEKTFIYTHIIDRMEKQLVNIQYETKKPIKSDDYEDDVIIIPADFRNNLTKSMRFNDKIKI